jgi:hypothetical protein
MNRQNQKTTPWIPTVQVKSQAFHERHRPSQRNPGSKRRRTPYKAARSEMADTIRGRHLCLTGNGGSAHPLPRSAPDATPPPAPAVRGVDGAHEAGHDDVLVVPLLTHLYSRRPTSDLCFGVLAGGQFPESRSPARSPIHTTWFRFCVRWTPNSVTCGRSALARDGTNTAAGVAPAAQPRHRGTSDPPA